MSERSFSYRSTACYFSREIAAAFLRRIERAYTSFHDGCDASYFLCFLLTPAADERSRIQVGGRTFASVFSLIVWRNLSRGQWDASVLLQETNDSFTTATSGEREKSVPTPLLAHSFPCRPSPKWLHLSVSAGAHVVSKSVGVSGAKWPSKVMAKSPWKNNNSRKRGKFWFLTEFNENIWIFLRRKNIPTWLMSKREQ